MALQTLVELVRSCAVGVSVALALDGAVGAHVSEVAEALVGHDAVAPDAALRAHGHAAGLVRAVAMAADAAEALVLVHALLRDRVTRVVPVLALVLRRALHELVRERRRAGRLRCRIVIRTCKQTKTCHNTEQPITAQSIWSEI